MRNNLTPNSSDVPSLVTQRISSPYNRTAGRDYVEHRQIKDIRLLLNTESKEYLDELALKNERFSPALRICREYRGPAKANRLPE